jgi:hypothetical protein
MNGRKGYSDNTENKALAYIFLAGKEGIYQKDLVSKMGNIDRTTIFRNAKRLERKRQIKTVREGKTTKYFCTLDNIFKDTALAGLLFGYYSSTEILNKRAPVISNEIHSSLRSGPDHKFHTVNIKCDNLRYFKHKFSQEKDTIEKLIFEFSNRIGAFILYTFINGLYEENSFTIGRKEKLTDRDKNILIQSWNKNVIDSFVLREALKEFRGSVFKLISNDFNVKFDFEDYELVEFERKKSTFTFNKKVYDKLCEAFAAVYPSIYQRLLEILVDPVLGLEAQTAIRKKGFKFNEEIRKLRNKSDHKHNFKMERVDSNWKYKRCPQCGKEEKEPVVSGKQ